MSGQGQKLKLWPTPPTSVAPPEADVE